MSMNVENFIENLIVHYRTSFTCFMTLLIQGDSGFATPEIYKLCEQFEQVFYLIHLKQNNILLTQAEQLLTEDPEETDITMATT